MPQRLRRMLRRLSFAVACSASTVSAAAAAYSASTSSAAIWAMTPSLAGTTNCVVTARYSPSPGNAHAVVRVDVGGGADQPLTAALEVSADRAFLPAGGHRKLGGLGWLQTRSGQPTERGQHVAPAT